MATQDSHRTYVVTGARSGIGKATVELLRSRGGRVVGVDLSGTDISADLTTRIGRDHAIAAVRAAFPDGLDALIECAGLSTQDGPAVVSVNYFGAVALAEGLRDLLARGHSPRCVIVSSSASFLPFDAEIVAACLAGDETKARALAAAPGNVEPGHRQGQVYAASKRAVTRWIRRTSKLPEWAGAGILLNGVAPGLVRTPMTIPLLETAEGRAVLAQAVPRAVANAAEPEDLALVLAFLASPDNRYLVGQVPVCDGGTDVLMRGDDVI